MMNMLIKALAAGALTLMVAGTAGAHGRGRVVAEVRPYYPAAVQVQPYYAPAPVYYDDRYVYARPDWRARRDWRREQWRREQWRRDHWHGHRHHDRCGHQYWRR